MKEELELKLVEKYPELCVDYLGDENKTCFAYGFECGDGWYDLIDETLGQVDSLAKSVGLGVKIGQIKSKLAELRIYLDINPGPSGEKVQQVISQIRNAVDIATEKSTSISEISGQPASRHSINNWLYTVTEDEAKSIKSKYEAQFNNSDAS